MFKSPDIRSLNALIAANMINIFNTTNQLHVDINTGDIEFYEDATLQSSANFFTFLFDNNARVDNLTNIEDLVISDEFISENLGKTFVISEQGLPNYRFVEDIVNISTTQGIVNNNGVLDVKIKDENSSGLIKDDDGIKINAEYENTNGIKLKVNNNNELFIKTDDIGNKEIDYPEFHLAVDVQNSNEYYFHNTTRRRSCNISGLANRNLTPYVVPFDGVITEATIHLTQGGVNANSVVFPVQMFNQVVKMQPSSSTLSNFTFDFNNGESFGIFTASNVGTTSATTLNISVTKGEVLGLRFLTGSSSSTIAYLRNAYIILKIEKS